MTVTAPYSWLKRLPASAWTNNEPFPFGSPPPFPWEQFNAIFSKMFQLENVQIEAGNWKLRQSNELYAGLGSHPVSLHCDVAPLQGTFCWVLADKDLEQLMSLLLTRKHDGGIIDPQYKKAFCQFLALELFSICNKLNFQKELTPHLLDESELPSEESYCLDVTINIGDKSIISRIIVTEELQHSWKERFANNKLEVNLPNELAEKIKLKIHLEGGSSTMRLSEWRQIQVGDFLLLDQCWLFAQEENQIMITLNRQPFFLAQINDGNVQILDYPLYHEAPITMVQNDDDDDEDLDDLDFDIEDNHTFSDETTEFTEESEETLEESEETSEGMEENSFIETDSIPKNSNGQSRTGIATSKKAPSTTPEKKPINIRDMTVNIVVELGQIEVSIQKLAELQPGSLLELNVLPEDGVDLTINGQIVAKGELLKIGESLGVRILEKGA